MSANWVFDVETEIFTYLKTKVTSELSSAYSDINFTMDDATQSNPKFPCVYIHFLSSTEEAETLDDDEIHAITSTIQYEVTVTKDQGMSACRRVSASVLTALKSLKFSSITTAEFQNNSADTKRMVGRARRVIAQGDSTIS